MYIYCSYRYYQITNVGIENATVVDIVVLQESIKFSAIAIQLQAEQNTIGFASSNYVCILTINKETNEFHIHQTFEVTSKVAIGYLKEINEISIIATETFTLQTITIDPNYIEKLHDNDYYIKLNLNNTQLIVSHESFALNIPIPEYNIVNYFTSRMFARPFEDGLIIYQHGTCSVTWYLDDQKQFCDDFLFLYIAILF